MVTKKNNHQNKKAELKHSKSLSRTSLLTLGEKVALQMCGESTQVKIKMQIKFDTFVYILLLSQFQSKRIVLQRVLSNFNPQKRRPAYGQLKSEQTWLHHQLHFSLYEIQTYKNICITRLDALSFVEKEEKEEIMYQNQNRECKGEAELLLESSFHF